MVNQQEMNSITQVDEFAEILAAARRMQQDWLENGLNFVHLYVEDVDGDWLETWGDDEVSNSLFDAIKEFLVSDDDVAVKIRYYLRNESLFDLAVNLEESLRIYRGDEKLFAVRDILIGNGDICHQELLELANNLVDRFSRFS
ncbi:hypothetical protein H6G54_04470 [Anabaena cylindrica FACHB-243]|uniref:Uncharacterized protein n=1 Tax=Anabaena cylindrica (strain ATCC 27899 / PCC 7122) TaxID=272123 RepID=K9ZJ62_ANACC|nr:MULTISPECIES: hypothetical protein [Anabaena]AFZ58385.1 hypothetical protein Anacy_2963 [Anabaena cylindrica PCC 7122]MBD2416981.1 hypothetical protein [Anabaena cylindrica FACHB-243]MBY5280196.1 hypothetical protein [Anabaena sp. CCAP 1446/1C]MBY5309361.1 hypothetical protein [Anabaena sp. CCAP 1446/1C]MCM2406515.1 hypothetical protein [Anabaena sp. CCAP 1446/1C]